jgi:hypothetical protein
MRRTLATVCSVTLLAGCHSKRDAEQLRREGLERAQANLREVDTLQKLGNDLQLQGKCTPAAVIAAEDPDRQYLACFGVNGGAGANPRLIEFRERYGTATAAVDRGCAEIQDGAWVGATQIYCAEAHDRKVAEAKLLRPEYEKANRCTNAAIREATDPDFHYLVCYGGLVSLTRYIDQDPRLNLFRDRYGPALEKIRAHCQELRTQLDEYRRASKAPSPQTAAGAAAQFQTAYTVYCTD